MRQFCRVLPALLAVALVLPLAGCLAVEMDTGVDSRHNAHLSYRLAVDATDLSAPQRRAVETSLNTLATYYRDELGFAVDIRADAAATGQYDVDMTRTLRGGNAGEAFDLLRDLLTDEKRTLMMTADLDRTDAGMQQAFYFEGTVALGELVRQSDVAGLPEDLRRELQAALEGCGGTFRLALPASEVEEASHEYALRDGVAVMEVPLTFEGQAEVKLVTRLNSGAGGLVGGATGQALERLKGLRMAVFAAVALAAVLVVAGLAGLLRRKRRR